MRAKKLFEPIKIRGMELKNRLVMPAMCTKLPDEFGAVTDRLIEFYMARARGGVGLLITENTCIDWPTGKAAQNPLRIDDDKYIMGLNELAEGVQSYGCKIATQPQHTGRQTSTTASTEGAPLVSASSVPCFVTGGDVPRPLTIEEIIAIEHRFVDAARRTKAAGMDCVEIHGAHGYLITQFMSPYTNKRNDAYGGNLENRMRFPLEIVRKTREAVGEDFPILFRISADEYVQGGLTLEDTRRIAPVLEEAGVDALSVSAGIYESMHLIMPGMGFPPGCHVALAEQIKKVVDIPVIAVGKIGDPLLAEQIVRDGQADLVAMGRALLADPDLPSKAKAGKMDDICPCIYCNQGCHGRVFKALRLSCSVNPACGNEITYSIRPAIRPEKVVVIGGGPGGIEAALTAAARGHDVTLVEKKDRIGGKLLTTASLPFKKDLQAYVVYLQNQLRKSKVTLILGTEANPETIRKLSPDILVAATGAQPVIPDIPGIDGDTVVHSEQILAGNKQTGERVAILGGGQVGCETAWFLGEQGKKLTIVEVLDDIATDVPPATRNHLLLKMKVLNVRLMIGSHALSISDHTVEVMDRNQKEHRVESDTVVIAMGYREDKDLAEKFQPIVNRFYVLGDCAKPATIYEAVHAGSKLARSI